ncbi:zinc finger, CCHC-type containing protein [Tanacetum coccineum]|uniref:Zinc finger, CCHC-type containing protein n=1 Tax=Tanacetum coccineum TaxID=301880 RepID=A0ABQ5DFB3_9ASTR
MIKSLYRLQKAPKQWHQKFNKVVLSSGYLLNQADKCVYSKFDKSGKRVIICLYVDNMLIFGTDQVHVDLKKEFLSSRFSLKDLGEADVILGIRVKHESNRIAISQSYYIEKVLKKFNYFNCIPVSTPMDTSDKLMPNNGQAVSQLEYTSNPSTQHWQAIQRVLKYLKKTMDYSLIYIGASSWASKKQTCITSSTIESEFMALAAAGKEAEWHSIIHELIMNGVVSIESMRSQQNFADHLTKGLSKDLVLKSAEGLGLKSNLVPECKDTQLPPEETWELSSM